MSTSEKKDSSTKKTTSVKVSNHHVNVLLSINQRLYKFDCKHIMMFVSPEAINDYS